MVIYRIDTGMYRIDAGVYRIDAGMYTVLMLTGVPSSQQ